MLNPEKGATMEQSKILDLLAEAANESGPGWSQRHHQIMGELVDAATARATVDSSAALTPKQIGAMYAAFVASPAMRTGLLYPDQLMRFLGACCEPFDEPDLELVQAFYESRAEAGNSVP
jgi:hypothetical protein